MKYYSLNEYLRHTFGTKAYKISLDAGCSCPNRDGLLDTRGCIFCSASGSGDFAEHLDMQKILQKTRRGEILTEADQSALRQAVQKQLIAGKARVEKKNKAGKYIAYFQAYTGTYAPVSYLRPIPSHKAVVPIGISVPEGLSFFHSRCPYLFFVSLPPCASQKGFKVPLDFPVRASVSPLPGVFQQYIARRAKRLAPCSMHAPAIPTHHEGNSFDLLFLVQAPNSFLFYTQLVSSNCLMEEKAGHLYAVCLLSDAKARRRAGLIAPARVRCRPVPSTRC